MNGRNIPSINNLDRIFTLQTGKNYLKTRESSTIEFKESFNFSGMSGYAKDLAAFTNNCGGYIVFGVKSRPHIPTGLQSNNFENIDEARMTEIINQYFSPAIEWEKYIHAWNRRIFGIIYAYESNDKPIIAVKNGQDIKEGEIYYRYAARTEKIHYAELKQIIDKKIQNERNAWQRLFERIAKIGPENAAILDTLAGRIESRNGTILIDDELIPKLKFIREGQFDEKKGAITLKLIGEVQPVSVVGIKQEIVPYDPYKLIAKDVAEQVAKAINRKFRSHPEHVKCWQYYNIRGTYEEGKAKCNTKYCDYKEAIKYFMYTQEWVDFLISELSDLKKYEEVTTQKY